MNEDVLKPWLDFPPLQIAKLRQRVLERRPIGAGHMQRAPKHRSGFDAGHADDVARLIVFLCSEANGNVNGQVIRTAGGL